MARMMTEAILQQQIQDYHDEINDNLLDSFRTIANKVSKHIKIIHDKNAIEEVVDLCIAKLPKYDANKSKAFNFFTTLISCSLMQAKRMQINRINN